MSNCKESKFGYFFGKIHRGGYYFSISFFIIAIVISLIGIFLFELWFFLVLGSTVFIAGNLYFSSCISYEHGCVSFPAIGKRTKDEYIIFIAYFIGVSIAGLAAFLTNYFLIFFKSTLQHPIISIIISFVISALIAYEVKKGIATNKNGSSKISKNIKRIN